MESNIASVATQDQVKITFNEICFSVQVPKGGAATQAGRGGAPSGKKGPFAKKEMQEKVILKGVSGVRREIWRKNAMEGCARLTGPRP